ncbi:hypothetical protein EV641_107114 [Rhodococcus sp. SMB37]|uniref:hypothetical protein n=1 Tax=Rhodococcus sp. SMB37 TaxID=2512213 RepID=UPI0006D20BE3|nr:hypothetical protein [Rhodococcus sp. SMB37]TCN52756.1 hypothetical protein EV641_107114 [Rhodococcus sp. SMB37]
MPPQSLLDRYEARRTRRFLKNEELTAHWLPGWRTQHRRRILAAIVTTLIATMFLIAIVSFFNMIVALAWLVVCLAFLPTWTCLQIVSGRQSDAPRHALDEREIAERNSARSIGLSVAQILVLIPCFALVFGATVDSIDHQSLAYSAGLFTIASILFSGCLPAILLAWNRPDDDPEDQS